jgi:hypothetical protein
MGSEDFVALQSAKYQSAEARFVLNCTTCTTSTVQLPSRPHGPVDSFQPTNQPTTSSEYLAS